MGAVGLAVAADMKAQPSTTLDVTAEGTTAEMSGRQCKCSADAGLVYDTCARIVHNTHEETCSRIRDQSTVLMVS